MTLKTKVRIILVATFLSLEVFQYLVVHNILVESYTGYIYLFLLGTTIATIAIIILYLESNILHKCYFLDRSIGIIAKLHKGSASRSKEARDEVSQITDYIYGILEELQQSKDALQNSRTMLATAQKFASVGSWDLDFKTGKVRCSEEMYRITGLDPHHINSDHSFMTNLIHPEDKQLVKKALQEAWHEDRLCSIDYRAILPGGFQHTLHAEGEVDYLSDKEIFRITGVLYDTTRQRAVQDLQSTNKEKCFSIVDNSPNPILIIDDKMAVQHVNEAFEKVTGYLTEDVLGIMPPYPWWPADSHEQYAKELSRLIQGRTKKGEFLYKKKNGRNISVRVIVRPLKNNGDVEYVFIYMFDITEQKRLRETMQYYVTEITRAQEAERKRIAYEIHDEIIQSLASLGLEVDALGKNMSRSQDDLPTRLQGLRRAIQEMVDKLRFFSHELHPSIIDQGILPALENLAQEVSLKAKINIQFTPYGNEQRLPVETELGLYRIAQEAVRNITKHSGATEAEIRLKYTQSRARLIISDNGIGFEVPEVLGDLSGKDKLGIISMQERARLFDGKLSLRSRMGKGTTVMVEIPITQQ